MYARASIMLAAIMSLSLLGCPDKPAPKTPPTPDKATPEATRTPVKKTTPDPPKPPTQTPAAKIQAALEAAASKCKEVTSHNIARGCPDKEQFKLERLVRNLRFKSFPPLVQALSQGTPKVKQLAAKQLYLHAPYHFGDLKRSGKSYKNRSGEVPKPMDSDVEILFTTLKSIDPTKNRLAHDAIRAAVLAGTVAKRYDDVRAMLAHYDPAKSQAHLDVHDIGLQEVMRFGRLELFDLIEAASTNKDQPRLQRAAFIAPRQMNKWSPEEDEKLCEWARGHLTRIEPHLEAGPARVLLQCVNPQKSRGKILDEMERRAKKKKLARPLSAVLSDVCVSSSFATDYTRKNPEICKRGKAIALKYARNRKLPAEVRVDALNALAMRWNDADAQKTFGALERERSPVGQTAKRHLKKKKK